MGLVPTKAERLAIDKRRRELLDEKQTYDARKVEQFQNELSRQRSKQFYEGFNQRMDAAGPIGPGIQYRQSLSPDGNIPGGPDIRAVAPAENDPARAPKMIANTAPRGMDLSKPAAPERGPAMVGMGAGGPENPTITADQVRAEIARRKAAAAQPAAPQGITADQVKAEIARRKAAAPASVGTGAASMGVGAGFANPARIVPISPLKPGASEYRPEIEGYKGKQFPTNWPKGMAAPPMPPQGYSWQDTGYSYDLRQDAPKDFVSMSPAQLRQMREEQAASAHQQDLQRKSNEMFEMQDGSPLYMRDDGTLAQPVEERPEQVANLADTNLGVRVAKNALNTAGPGTINAGLDMAEMAASNVAGGPAMRTYAAMQNQQEQPRITFGAENASKPQPQDMRLRVPELPMQAPEDGWQAGADVVGQLAGFMATPGQATEAALKATGATNALMRFAPQGSSAAAKAGRYGARILNPIDDVAHAAAFGAVTAEDGKTAETALQYATDPINYLGRPIASLIQRGGIALSTMGKRVTPEAIELERVMALLKGPNPTPAQVQEAAQIIDRLSPPAPTPTRAKDGGPELAAAREAAEAPVEPKPFSQPPTPSGPGVVRRNLDRVATGAGGAFLGGVGDAVAAPDDGTGAGGLPGGGATTGALVGLFGPRLAAQAASRGARAAARLARAPGARAAFDERVAARAVRKSLVSGGLKTEQEALEAARARFGDKPAAVADLTQDSVGTATGLSRLPGATGEAARARGEDLLQNQPGRVFGDIAGTTGIDPASVTQSIDDAIRAASEEISPAYEELFAANRGVNSERLMQLADDPIIGQYVRAAIKEAESLQTTAGQAPSNARTWDLVKRGLDRTIETQKRSGGQASYALEQARAAVKAELDALMPGYKAVRDQADAPRMRDARKKGAQVMSGAVSVENVKKLASSLTGRPLTALQAGMIEKIVPGVERGKNIQALASGRTKGVLEAAFGADVAEQLVARIRSDVAIVENARRINPNVGSVTSQANMGGGEGAMAAAANVFRAVRSPVEAALAAMSKSGSYSKAQRDLMGEMLLDGPTPENLARIYRGKTKGGAPNRTPPAPNTGLGQSSGPLPGQTSSASPTVTSALVGGGLGYVGSDGDPTTTLASAIGGGAIGAVAGKMAKGGKKPSRGSKAPPGAGPRNAPVQRSYFAGPRGNTYEVTIEGTGRGAEVNFRPQGGDYAASGNMSLAEVNDVFRNVEKAIRDDIATNPKPRYVLEGATKQRRDIYEQIAKTRAAPEGYRWEMVSESGRRPYLTLTRSDAPPPASAPKQQASKADEIIDLGVRYPKTVDVGNVKLRYFVENGRITISEMDVPKELRGQGNASRVLDGIVRQADRRGLEIKLIASAYDGSPLSNEQLIGFYQSRGFEPDPSSPIEGAMLRRPSGSAPKPPPPKAEAPSQGGGASDAEAHVAKAEQQGFDTTRILYHGSSKQFDTFDMNKVGTREVPWYGNGAYLSPDRSVARRYASSDQNVMPFFVRGKLLKVDRDNPIPEWLSKSRDYAATLKAQGYSGLEVGGHSPEVVVYDPSDIMAARPPRAASPDTPRYTAQPAPWDKTGKSWVIMDAETGTDTGGVMSKAEAEALALHLQNYRKPPPVKN